MKSLSVLFCLDAKKNQKRSSACGGPLAGQASAGNILRGFPRLARAVKSNVTSSAGAATRPPRTLFHGYRSSGGDTPYDEAIDADGAPRAVYLRTVEALSRFGAAALQKVQERNGLPGPIICDFLSREASRATYAPGHREPR